MNPTTPLDPEGTIRLLSKVLRGTPRLYDAACTSSQELFDTTEPVDAVEALELCSGCPCLELCRAWADAQPRSHLNGVVGGQIRRLRPSIERKKPRRPKLKPKPSCLATVGRRPGFRATGWRRARRHDRMTRRSLNRRLADLVLVSEDPDRLVREGPMSSFDIDVFRDGGWWMVHIPELGGLTQARYPREVELMAREYIAVSTGTPIDQVAINWRGCTL
jgi:hypothetical protein